MSNIQVESDLKEILTRIDNKLHKLSKDVTDIKVSLAEVRDIKTLDTKIDGLEKRVGNQEFTNRGVLIGLISVILGSVAKFLDIMGNP